MPGMEGIKMLSAMGPSAVTAIRMPSDGRRTSGAAVPPEEESEGLCAGARMGTAGGGLPGGGSSSEERREGKGGVSTGRSRGTTDQKTNKRDNYKWVTQ